MANLLTGKIALVTGGTSGMGAATVKAYCQEGATVIIGGTNITRGENLAKEMCEAGYTARFYGPMDITKDEQIKNTVDSLIKEFGRIDIFCQFAGRTFGAEGNLDNINMADWDKTLNVNLTGNFKSALAVVPYMKEQKSGRIIFCSSNGAFNPTTTTYHYHAAKAAIESVTVNMAFELATFGINVNCIVPGAIMTPFWDALMPPGKERDAFTEAIAKKEIPLGRMGNGEDIAGVAVFFASEQSRYVTGLRMFVAGGMGYIHSKESTFFGSSENTMVNSQSQA
ncbi:SDR family NAD(P)-dependent oxidoreductase [Acetobacterium woodii]|uniref:3-oxoacyl-[acyl-carrier-protein] reductase FabG5 n=1 Tax=Acetobacterium woodii (strain ATCC 29683 / DSM 1030 / JCM 2381 / KCTC 1655 / WB1) TaxID=931626 RepID=H6LIP5_ACEWD|nr:SDR family oxidoreductase [Acetobacterium woodii]AFA48619.1 3-oxoacyl-[acyl-carrier-protein] reductase FabG5 [Acetobacterium woodii DSM 1030]